MTFEDQTLSCSDCGADFTFTVGEQEFYQEKGLSNKPKRCTGCRSARKNSRGGGGGGGRGGSKQFFDAVCSACGKDTTVPFKPTRGRDIYCRDCM